MKKKDKSKLIPSGNALVDFSWGGFYKGGIYFLTGPKESGKTILALQFALNSINESNRSLILTTSGINDLIINSSVINLNLQKYIDQGIVTVVRMSTSKNISHYNDQHFSIKEYFEDLNKLIQDYTPVKIVFDEFSPFINFSDYDLVRELILQTKKDFNENAITGLFILGEDEPAQIQKFNSELLNLSTGYICLFKNENLIGKSNPGMIKIIPNTENHKGEFSSKYFIEINKGFEIELDPFDQTN